jgi:hypothetical protein
MWNHHTIKSRKTPEGLAEGKKYQNRNSGSMCKFRPVGINSTGTETAKSLVNQSTECYDGPGTGLANPSLCISKTDIFLRVLEMYLMPLMTASRNLKE